MQFALFIWGFSPQISSSNFRTNVFCIVFPLLCTRSTKQSYFKTISWKCIYRGYMTKADDSYLKCSFFLFLLFLSISIVLHNTHENREQQHFMYMYMNSMNSLYPEGWQKSKWHRFEMFVKLFFSCSLFEANCNNPNEHTTKCCDDKCCTIFIVVFHFWNGEKSMQQILLIHFVLNTVSA